MDSPLLQAPGWNRSHRFVPFLFLLVWLAGPIGGVALPASAQEFQPSDQGLPGRREGGGTRGGCLTSGNSESASQPATLTALMPNSNVGLTITDYPVFSWYVPQNSATAAEFVLLDQANSEVYKAVIPVVNQPGVVSLRLPTDGTVTPLAVGKSYQWYFSLICDPLDRSADTFTSGWVQRIEPSSTLTQALTNAATEEKPDIYAKAGIWYEALAMLIKLRQEQPQNTAFFNQWQTLLKSVGLEKIADQPLLPEN